MATYNKFLESLTKDQVIEISEKYLRGWVNIQTEYKIMLRGLNHRRDAYGLPRISRDQVFDYRDSYVKDHYSYEERVNLIDDYLSKHKMNFQRGKGIFLFNCRFDVRYAKAFRSLIGKETFDYLSEKNRVNKMMSTQIKEYGGVGLGSTDTLNHALKTKVNRIVTEMDKYLSTGSPSIYLSNSVPDTELLAFKKLVDYFGRNDVFYQYGLFPKDNRYPFNCDFYIKSLDLFIELNYHYSHNDHWFDKTNECDVNKYNEWKHSHNIKYRKAAYNWAITDLQKRKFAEDNGLNYLVFWRPSHGKISVAEELLSSFDDWLFDYSGNFKKFIIDHPENSY